MFLCFHLQSRLSPFANTKAQRGRKEGKEACTDPSLSKSKEFKRWFSLLDATSLSRKRTLLPVKNLQNSLFLSNELHRTLYGFIVFEVSWTNVRGINYLNELQVLPLLNAYLLFVVIMDIILVNNFHVKCRQTHLWLSNLRLC